ncbi:MAG: enoyl-CoA hydratase/isomerase family protein [Gammaproteobacteria bacterium]|nr:enoyl-CoA hydratase/isomerase family protein [Gammaproteobacteria bacterium]
MIEVKNHGRVRELRLARPPVNALNCALVKMLDQRISEVMTAVGDSAQSVSAPRAIVISGSPGLFCAGLDLHEITSGEASAKNLVFAFAMLQRRLVDSAVPVIAAITGHCPAGGAVIAILCDHRIMAAGDFRIGLNEVQVGLYPGELIYRVYERLVGTRRAALLLPRGIMLRSDEALEAGLVDEVVASEQVVTRAIALAQELIALPPKTYVRTRNLVRADLRRLFDSPPETLESLMAEGWVTDETRERAARLLTSR